MKKVPIVFAAILCACNTPTEKKTEQAVSDSTPTAIVSVPKKVQVPKTATDVPELPLNDLLVKFFDSLTSFHVTMKIVDSVTGRDFAETPLIYLQRDTTTRDSITAQLMVRSDSEEQGMNRFFVRYTYSSTFGDIDTTKSSMFYIWKEDQKIKYETIECDCELKSKGGNSNKSLPIEKQDMKVIAKFFLQHSARKS